MKSHLLAKKRRREDLNLALCWTVSVTVSLCWTSTNIISICNILYLQCIKWLQFCTVKVRYLGCTRGRFLLRRAKTSSCLPKSCQVMKTTLKAAGMAWPGILCQQRSQIFQQVKSCFHLSCQPGKDVASSIWLGAVQRLSIIDKITFKSKVESYKTGIYKKVPSTTL